MLVQTLRREVLFFLILSFFCTYCVFLQAEESGAPALSATSSEWSASEWEASASEWEALEWKNIEGKEVSLFVNSDVASTLMSENTSFGSAKQPFKSVDEAFLHIATLVKKKKKIKVVLNITGHFISSYSYIVNCPIKIVGHEKRKDAKANVEFRKNAGFMVSSSPLMLENILLTRKEVVGEPRTVPLFYVSGGEVGLKAVNVEVKEGGGVFFFRSSKFELNDVFVNSRQADYCNIIEAHSSKGKIYASKFTSVSRSAIALDSIGSEVMIDGLMYESRTSYFSFFVRAFSSSLYIASTSLSEKGSAKEKRVAIIYDENSQLKDNDVKLAGFASLAEVRKGKLDYLK